MTTRFFAVAGLAWTLVCAVGFLYVWRDEEIPVDGGAVAAAWVLTVLVAAAWLVPMSLVAVSWYLGRQAGRR